jgi:pimeloyl-ACP methyl ester carboxylesterase
MVACVAGCSSLKLKSFWIDGGKPTLSVATHAHAIVPTVPWSEQAEGRIDWLQMACRRHKQAEAEALLRNPACVDNFYSAVLWSWQSYVEQDTAPETPIVSNASIQQYNTSLARLLRAGQMHQRLHPTSSLQVNIAGVPATIPMQYHGFAWEPADFQECTVVGAYANHMITERKISSGIGVPVVVKRTRAPKLPHESDFLPSTACFAATAVLKPDGSGLALYNPITFETVEIEGRCLPLARDLTASLAYSLHHHSQTRVQDFLRPDSAQASSKLYFLEPFQPDKIPVLFVHGLLSNPDAWADIYNELRADPQIAQTYQFWAFKYSTGAPFIRSASVLRSQMDEACDRFDRHHENPLLRRGVMIGHSMGGLISELMVAYSGEEVWESIANIPLEQVATPETTRASLAQRLFFDPHPMASRVVFIATPHRGSQTASGAIGKVASSLVVQSDSSFDQLTEDNPGGFKDYVTQGLPTSIQLLDPKQPFLGVLERLKLSECVPLHSIIGNGNLLVGHHRGDGVVSVTSARHHGADSELLVPSTHNGVLRHRDTFNELKRILRLHVSDEMPRQAASAMHPHEESSSEVTVPGGLDLKVEDSVTPKPANEPLMSSPISIGN